ncbi:hypothetical protein GY45DRAFT_1376390 [Cubamyces sp. BRFM 1775]|nr:hypothetical protein GY45DRAFT_1376390 [Cubamyces sp. BRFM 1775]
MLVLHPNSQCDVCLDYYTANREPHAIGCGHVFCQRCLQSLIRPSCPLCRTAFQFSEVRRLHVDKATLPPATPQSSPPDLDSADRARQFQTQLTRIIRGGATASDMSVVQSELKPWLSTQRPEDHADLRATYTLLYQFTKHKQALADVEQKCTILEEQLENERQHAAADYEALEKQASEEREALLAAQNSLEEGNARLLKECEELRAKVCNYAFCNEFSDECRRLSDELKELKSNTLPPLSRPIEARHFYLHDLSGSKADPIAILKDSADSTDAVKVHIVGKDKIFQLSPVPPTEPIPDLPSSLMTFQPLTDDIDEAIDDDAGHRLCSAPTSRAIPIQVDSNPPRSRSHSSGLNFADPDAMSISVPRSTLDVHMASVSSSPNVSTMQYSLRPVEFVSSSLRVPENALGLRTAEPIRTSPTTMNSDMMEYQERTKRLAILKEVLTDSPSPASSLSRRPTISDVGPDRARAAAPTRMISTRTPSPVSSASQSYSMSSVDGSGTTQRHYLLQPGISSASMAAMEHQQRTRASSTASTTPAPSVAHAPTTRDRDTTPPMHTIYAPAPPPAPSPSRPPPQPRRQSTEPASISKGKAALMGIVPTGPYQSGLTRSMRAMQEAPRVS